MPVPRSLRHLLAALAAGLAPALASAQLAPRPARPAVLGTVSINPLGIPFGVAAAEAERTVGTGGVALGVGAFTTIGGDLFDDEYRYTSAQLKLKYYPAERGLRGFAVGVTAGVAHARDVRQVYAYDPGSGSFTGVQPVRRSATAPTLGAVLDYNFLIGRRQRFLVGLGVGARRVLAGERSREPLGHTIPDGRLQIGFGY